MDGGCDRAWPFSKFGTCKFPISDGGNIRFPNSLEELNVARQSIDSVPIIAFPGEKVDFANSGGVGVWAVGDVGA